MSNSYQEYSSPLQERFVFPASNRKKYQEMETDRSEWFDPPSTRTISSGAFLRPSRNVATAPHASLQLRSSELDKATIKRGCEIRKKARCGCRAKFASQFYSVSRRYLYIALRGRFVSSRKMVDLASMRRSLEGDQSFKIDDEVQLFLFFQSTSCSLKWMQVLLRQATVLMTRPQRPAAIAARTLAAAASIERSRHSRSPSSSLTPSPPTPPAEQDADEYKQEEDEEEKKPVVNGNGKVKRELSSPPATPPPEPKKKRAARKSKEPPVYVIPPMEEISTTFK